MRYANGDAPGTVALHVLNSCKTKSELKNSFVSFASEDQVKQFSADAEAISPPGRYTTVTTARPRAVKAGCLTCENPTVIIVGCCCTCHVLTISVVNAKLSARGLAHRC